MAQTERKLYFLFGGILGIIIVVGLVIQGPVEALRGCGRIILHPARLINDFTLAGGEGAALINAALTSLMGLILVRVNHIKLSGPTVAAIFTILGFGLFGKTPLNVLPVMLGVYASARFLRKSFKEYILIALFGTALGPVVSAVAVEAGLSGTAALGAGLLGGFVIGTLLPAAAMSMLRLHQGFNLYNIGLTSGFLALFAASLFAASGTVLPPQLVWNESPGRVLVLFIPVLSTLLVISGLFLEGFGVFKALKRIQKLSGRLPSDFMDMATPGGALLNMGFLGLAAWIYVTAVGGDLNGPVIGGILTIMGFASFGKNLRNTWPVVTGAVAATLLFGKGLDSPGPLLAALFCTTLAPLSGEFGVPVGFMAGFVHLMMVERTGAWHSGMNLYNNGFAGGLTAALFVAVIEWYRANRPKPRSFKKKESVTPRDGGK